jgi:hypothetical protein
MSDAATGYDPPPLAQALSEAVKAVNSSDSLPSVL